MSVLRLFAICWPARVALLLLVLGFLLELAKHVVP